MTGPVLPKLIVHIGQGKTGSTAIQRTLAGHRDAVRAAGAAYLGIMLEQCETARPMDWQVPQAAHRLFHQMEDDQVADQVYAVLREELERLGTAGVHTAIWSHEAIFARRVGVSEALMRLRREGVDLRIICYLRRHDRLARSSYSQWGIRHKPYDGPVQPFSQWIVDHPVRYGDIVEFWAERFDDAFEPVNYDVLDDVVSDFMGRTGLPEIAGDRHYETPKASILAAWATYNSRSEAPILPERFNRIMHHARLNSGPLPNLPDPAALFPSDADLAQVLDGAEADLARVNAVLTGRGQPEFSTKDPAVAAPVPSDWEMLQLALSMVFSLQEQVIQLRKQLDTLDR